MAKRTPHMLVAVRQRELRRERMAGVWVYRSSDPAVARRLQGHAPPIALSQVSAVFTRFDLAQVAQKGGSADC